jgi:hypothetical protein
MPSASRTTSPSRPKRPNTSSRRWAHGRDATLDAELNALSSCNSTYFLCVWLAAPTILQLFAASATEPPVTAFAEFSLSVWHWRLSLRREQAEASKTDAGFSLLVQNRQGDCRPVAFSPFSANGHNSLREISCQLCLLRELGLLVFP